jgi:2'-5' RNA ligase
MSGRVFLALQLTETARQHLSDALGRAHADAVEQPGLHWVPPQRWHVTVLFLGVVAPQTRAALSDHLASLTPTLQSVRWSLAAPQLVPSRSRPRLLWLPVRTPDDHLQRLHRRSRSLARQQRVAVERRPFRPHLTLARVRRPGEVEAARAVGEAMSAYRGPESVSSSVALMASSAGPRPEYTVLRSFGLAAEPGSDSGRWVDEPPSSSGGEEGGHEG